ncbi:hypothetical protein G647_06171 [Cladophialophora carrionii CBS 160.54]|uniref:Cytochrome b561 domain-containing protein n=1 Tax=Cladophialophora carrionii CBS 160.54 TaxID=1279043 RepID=V9D5E5_9EURO|nr:uncharacterized protein G647_06171 [Cladophialophora carrionii CBS 160.54]ETI22100.1 hypothetical protein G647_06171 [Cladophialophora carrionii CBS 160.54]
MSGTASHESHLLSRAAPPATKHLSDKVHGILMGVTVILIFPFGSICWRLLDGVVSGKTLLRIHVCCQVLGLGMLVSGFGVGVWVCIIHNSVYNDEWGHGILGTIVTALFLLQPVLGQWHHILYKRGRSQGRTFNPWFRTSHVWLGRLLMVAAIVNGATGIVLANNTPGGEKGYSAAAGVVGLIYIVILSLWYWNRSKQDAGEARRDHDHDVLAGHVEDKSGTAVAVGQV